MTINKVLSQYPYSSEFKNSQFSKMINDGLLQKKEDQVVKAVEEGLDSIKKTPDFPPIVEDFSNLTVNEMINIQLQQSRCEEDLPQSVNLLIDRNPGTDTSLVFASEIKEEEKDQVSSLPLGVSSPIDVGFNLGGIPQTSRIDNTENFNTEFVDINSDQFSIVEFDDSDLISQLDERATYSSVKTTSFRMFVHNIFHNGVYKNFWSKNEDFNLDCFQNYTPQDIIKLAAHFFEAEKDGVYISILKSRSLKWMEEIVKGGDNRTHHDFHLSDFWVAKIRETLPAFLDNPELLNFLDRGHTWLGTYFGAYSTPFDFFLLPNKVIESVTVFGIADELCKLLQTFVVLPENFYKLEEGDYPTNVNRDSYSSLVARNNNLLLGAVGILPSAKKLVLDSLFGYGWSIGFLKVCGLGFGAGVSGSLIGSILFVNHTNKITQQLLSVYNGWKILKEEHRLNSLEGTEEWKNKKDEVLNASLKSILEVLNDNPPH